MDENLKGRQCQVPARAGGVSLGPHREEREPVTHVPRVHSWDRPVHARTRPQTRVRVRSGWGRPSGSRSVCCPARWQPRCRVMAPRVGASLKGKPRVG